LPRPGGRRNAISVIAEREKDGSVVRDRANGGRASCCHADKTPPGMGRFHMSPTGENLCPPPLHETPHLCAIRLRAGRVAPCPEEKTAVRQQAVIEEQVARVGAGRFRLPVLDRKSTRLNSSHVKISYAVFCLKKKKTCS